MEKKGKKVYTNFSNVENMDDLIPEEFPEGAFGSSYNKNESVSAKSTPWEEGQRRTSAFTYPYKKIHDDLPRQTPGAHPLHDEEGDPKDEM